VEFRVGNRVEAEKLHSLDSEQELLQAFLGEIRDGDIVYDIGGNIGLYAILSAERLRGSGRVLAFEPVPLWASRLRENASLNRLTNLSVFEVGLFDKEQRMPLVLKNIQGSGMGSVVTDYGKAIPESQLERIEIELVRGDEFVERQELPQPDVIKLDVEGAEVEVLEGLRATLTGGSCRFVMCEVHPGFMPHDPRSVELYLKGLGFGVELVGERRDQYHLLARR